MRAVRKTTALVIRPRSFWKRHVIYAVTAFCLTAAAVYLIWLNYYRKSSHEIGSSATAVVEQKPGIDQAFFPADSIFGSPLHLTNIKTRVLSPEFLTQALRECGIDISQTEKNGSGKVSIITPDQLRQGLNIFTIAETVKGEKQILFELELRESPDAARIVRALADRFVYEFRTYWTVEIRKTYQAALIRTEQARHEQDHAIEKLKSLKDDIAKSERLDTEPKLSQPQTAQPDANQTVDNPAWVELNEKLASLQEQETEMLENKTELHPDVINLRDRMADVDQQLELTPRFSVENTPDNLASDGILPSLGNVAISTNESEIKGSSSPEGNAVTGQNELNTSLKQLQDVVTNTTQAYEQEMRQEQQIFEASRQEPTFSISINTTAMAIKEQKVNRGLVEIMLYSGIVVGLGISVISSGASVKPVLATIADLEPLLPVPIIGVVPSKDVSFDPVARRRRQIIGRWSMIMAGIFIVLGCIGSMYWFLGKVA